MKKLKTVTAMLFAAMLVLCAGCASPSGNNGSGANSGSNSNTGSNEDDNVFTEISDLSVLKGKVYKGYELSGIDPKFGKGYVGYYFTDDKNEVSSGFLYDCSSLSDISSKWNDLKNEISDSGLGSSSSFFAIDSKYIIYGINYSYPPDVPVKVNSGKTKIKIWEPTADRIDEAVLVNFN